MEARHNTVIKDSGKSPPGVTEMTTRARDKAAEWNLNYTGEETEHEEEHRTEHRTDHPNSNYQAMNQHMVKFNDELKAVNEQVALDFDQRKNPADYDLSERKEMLEAVEHAFNETNWNTPSERWEGARDIAQSLFQPMYRRVELAEAAAQYKFPEDLLGEMRKENVDEVHLMDDGGGNVTMMFSAKDIETAERMVKESNGQLQIVSTWPLDSCKEGFTKALYNSDKNPKSRELMEKHLDGAISYYNGEVSWGRKKPDGGKEEGADLLTERTEGETKDLKQAVEAESGLEGATEHPDETGINDREIAAVRELEGMNEDDLDHHIQEIMKENLQHTSSYADSLRQMEHPDANAVAEVQRTLEEIQYDALTSSVDRGDEESFSRIMQGTEGADERLAREMAEANGFVGNEEYQQVQLAGEFRDLDTIREYAREIEKLAEKHQGDMSPMNYEIITQMLQRLDGRIETMEPIQKEWDEAGYEPGVGEVPEGLTDPRDLKEDFREMHDIAEGMDYLMRPEDPVFWKLKDAGANERMEKLNGMVGEYLNGAVGEDWEGMEEDRDFVAETLKMMFGKKLDFEQHTESQLLELGYAPAAAFRESYGSTLEEMENLAGYMATIRDGTSDITAEIGNGMSNPIEEFTFDPDSRLNEKQQRLDYVNDGMNFVLQYENMLGNGRHNPEGSPENLQLLHHITNRCSDAMREIFHTPGSFDERIQEVVQCSRMMTGMVTRREREKAGAPAND